MTVTEYRVTGMTCGHCETSVREAGYSATPVS